MPYRKYTPNFALLDAVRRGSQVDIRDAVTQGADIHAKSTKGQSVLEVAQANAKAELVPLLTQLGADPNQTFGKQSQTLLHRCAKSGDVGFCNALLHAKADPNRKNELGQTPLYLAAAGGWEYLARSLVEAGADIELSTNNGNTAKQVAFQKGHVSLARYLTDSATPSVATGNSWTKRVAGSDQENWVSGR